MRSLRGTEGYDRIDFGDYQNFIWPTLKDLQTVLTTNKLEDFVLQEIRWKECV